MPSAVLRAKFGKFLSVLSHSNPQQRCEPVSFRSSQEICANLRGRGSVLPSPGSGAGAAVFPRRRGGPAGASRRGRLRPWGSGLASALVSSCVGLIFFTGGGERSKSEGAAGAGRQVTQPAAFPFPGPQPARECN